MFNPLKSFFSSPATPYGLLVVGLGVVVAIVLGAIWVMTQAYLFVLGGVLLFLLGKAVAGVQWMRERRWEAERRRKQDAEIEARNREIQELVMQLNQKYFNSIKPGPEENGAHAKEAGQADGPVPPVTTEPSKDESSRPKAEAEADSAKGDTKTVEQTTDKTTKDGKKRRDPFAIPADTDPRMKVTLRSIVSKGEEYLAEQPEPFLRERSGPSEVERARIIRARRNDKREL